MQNQPELLLPLSYPINSFILLQSFLQYSMSIEKESVYLSELTGLARHSEDIAQQLQAWVADSTVSNFSITGLVLN